MSELDRVDTPEWLIEAVQENLEECKQALALGDLKQAIESATWTVNFANSLSYKLEKSDTDAGI